MDWIRRKIYGPTLNEQNREWQATLRRQQRQQQRQIDDLSRLELSTQRQVKVFVKKGDMRSARILAKEIVGARKQLNRLKRTKAILASLVMQLNEQIAAFQISGTLQKSTSVMKQVNGLLSLPQLNTELRQLSQELTKAGIIEEMTNEAMDSINEDDAFEDEEVENSIESVIKEIVGETPESKTNALPQTIQEPKQTLVEEGEEEEEDEEGLNRQLSYMRDQLARLQN